MDEAKRLQTTNQKEEQVMATTEKAMKIMQKPYHLVHDGIADGEEIVVHPPHMPGLNKDFQNPKNEKGEWIRVFTVADNGSRSMRKGKEIVLTHAPGEVPECIIDGVRWYIRPIPGVRAMKKRGAERKGFKGQMVADHPTTTSQAEQPVKRGRGRPKGSKNKPKLPETVNGQPTAEAAPKRRGRPPGSKNKPKTLTADGGTINVTAVGSAVAHAVQTALASVLGLPIPKRRGRPPGSKNKPKVENGSAAQTTGEQPVKRGRGRPPGSKNKAKSNDETYQKRLKALEKARAARKAKLEAAVKEPEVVSAT